MLRGAFSLIELLAAMAVVAILAAVSTPVVLRTLESSSLAISANNIRQLSVGGINYLAEHDHIFWKYRDAAPAGQSGTTWWFGFESSTSQALPEGQRQLDANLGPLAGYVPAGLRPDPSFTMGGKAFKPKYQFGYIGVGYNVLLGGGWLGTSARPRLWALSDPSKVVVFATSAQVNTFQSPASPSNPMLEEFYGFDAGGPPWSNPASIHFQHGGCAMVAFANGSAGLVPMDRSTLDPRLPKANVGRFAPIGNTLFLQ